MRKGSDCGCGRIPQRRREGKGARLKKGGFDVGEVGENKKRKDRVVKQQRRMKQRMGRCASQWVREKQEEWVGVRVSG